MSEQPPQQRFSLITERSLADLRQLVGVTIEDTLEPWCHEATRDNIRHYANGIGDDNPLWCDPDYARGTSYGDVIALPSFAFALSRILSGYVGGLPGVHAMWAGAIEADLDVLVKLEFWLAHLISSLLPNTGYLRSPRFRRKFY